jgi:Na+/H+-dicarboxylate symporter
MPYHTIPYHAILHCTALHYTILYYTILYYTTLYCIVLLRSVRRLLVTANVVPSSSILVTLTMEALQSSEESVLSIATRRNIPENGILHLVQWLRMVEP